MAKQNTRRGNRKIRLVHKQGNLMANLFFLREYMVRYLQLRNERIHFRNDKQVMKLTDRLRCLPGIMWKQLEMSLLAFDPQSCEPPRTILCAGLENWPGLVASGALEHTRKSVEREFPLFALHLSVCGEGIASNSSLRYLQSKVYLWLSEENISQLSKELLQDSQLFSELYFDQQVREVCRMYGAHVSFSPSLQ